MAKGGGLIYVYCVVKRYSGRSESRRPPALPRGSGFGGVVEIPFKDISALASSVPSERFSQFAVDQGMKNPAWLAGTAARHESAVESFMQSESAVIPMKLCTIFRTKSRVASMLKERYSLLKRSLNLTRESQEFGVKAYASGDELANAIRNGVGGNSGNKKVAHLQRRLATSKPGAAYFLRQDLDEAILRLVRRELSAVSKSIVEDLKRASTAWTMSNSTVTAIPEPNNHSNLESAGGGFSRSKVITNNPGQRVMLLNASFLVKKDRAGNFTREFDEVRRKYSRSGVELRLSGPWPPYNFT